MQLTHESLLPYQGFHGTQGLCHVRLYEQPGRLPVVIAGALDHAPGTSVTNAIEMVAAAIQTTFFADGREFELIEHHSNMLGSRAAPSFTRVRFVHRGLDENPGDPSNYAGTIVSIGGEEMNIAHGRPIPGDFRDPSWEEIADIEQLLGCEVKIWPVGAYTARAVAGDRGDRLRDELAAQTSKAMRQLIVEIEPDV
jgi:hypothetical protein